MHTHSTALKIRKIALSLCGVRTVLPLPPDEFAFRGTVPNNCRTPEWLAVATSLQEQGELAAHIILALSGCPDRGD